MAAHLQPQKTTIEGIRVIENEERSVPSRYGARRSWSGGKCEMSFLRFFAGTARIPWSSCSILLRFLGEPTVWLTSGAGRTGELVAGEWAVYAKPVSIVEKDVMECTERSWSSSDAIFHRYCPRDRSLFIGCHCRRVEAWSRSPLRVVADIVYDSVSNLEGLSGLRRGGL